MWTQGRPRSQRGCFTASGCGSWAGGPSGRLPGHRHTGTGRGITIFFQAGGCRLGERELTLLDTPGHVDFSSEMERTLQVLDYAVLVISGADGVQGHTQTLWRLLARYQIPCFVCQQNGPGRDGPGSAAERAAAAAPMAASPLTSRRRLWEQAAMCDEDALEDYLETGEERFPTSTLPELIARRKLFPPSASAPR